MNNVDITDEGDEQGIPTYVQAAHSDGFDEYVWPPAIDIINCDDFIGEKPKVETFVRPVNDLENTIQAHYGLNHIPFPSNRSSAFFCLKFFEEIVV